MWVYVTIIGVRLSAGRPAVTQTLTMAFSWTPEMWLMLMSHVSNCWVLLVHTTFSDLELLPQSQHHRTFKTKKDVILRKFISVQSLTLFNCSMYVLGQACNNGFELRACSREMVLSFLDDSPPRLAFFRTLFKRGPSHVHGLVCWALTFTPESYPLTSFQCHRCAIKFKLQVVILWANFFSDQFKLFSGVTWTNKSSTIFLFFFIFCY